MFSFPFYLMDRSRGEPHRVLKAPTKLTLTHWSLRKFCNRKWVVFKLFVVVHVWKIHSKTTLVRLLKSRVDDEPLAIHNCVAWIKYSLPGTVLPGGSKLVSLTKSNWLISAWPSSDLDGLGHELKKLKLTMMTSSNGNISTLLVFLWAIHRSSVQFPAQSPVTRSFDIFFDLRLNKGMSKQWWGWWFETPSRRL